MLEMLIWWTPYILPSDFLDSHQFLFMPNIIIAVTMSKNRNWLKKKSCLLWIYASTLIFYNSDFFVFCLLATWKQWMQCYFKSLCPLLSQSAISHHPWTEKSFYIVQIIGFSNLFPLILTSCHINIFWLKSFLPLNGNASKIWDGWLVNFIFVLFYNFINWINFSKI